MSDHVFVVIPTYNERWNIETLLSQLFTAVPTLHVLIVDDGSPDGTGEVADELRARYPQCQVIHRPTKLGLGSAYRTGLRAALRQGAQVILMMDGDLSHDPRLVKTFLQRMDGVEVVIGSRYIPGGGVLHWPWRRKWLSRLANGYARRMSHLPIYDVTSGFYAFRREILDRIPLEEMRSSGYAFQIELKWLCHRAGARCLEIPITFTDRLRGDSKMSFQEVLQALALCTRLWRRRHDSTPG